MVFSNKQIEVVNSWLTTFKPNCPICKCDDFMIYYKFSLLSMYDPQVTGVNKRGCHFSGLRLVLRWVRSGGRR